MAICILWVLNVAISSCPSKKGISRKKSFWDNQRKLFLSSLVWPMLSKTDFLWRVWLCPLYKTFLPYLTLLSFSEIRYEYPKSALVPFYFIFCDYDEKLKGHCIISRLKCPLLRDDVMRGPGRTHVIIMRQKKLPITFNYLMCFLVIFWHEILSIYQ